jgi:regulatory protein
LAYQDQAVVPGITAFFMHTITALRQQKRNHERVNVFLDGEFAFGLPLDAALSLRVGDALSDERIEALRELDEYDKAKNAALRLLTYRPRSSAEIRRKLQEKQFDDNLIQRVIERLGELRLLDDEAFARYWLEQRERFKPRSAYLLRQELRQKGVPSDIVERVLDDVDEAASALKAAQQRARRYAHLPFEEFQQKLGGYLQRRGFNYALARDAVGAAWQTAQRDAPDSNNDMGDIEN